MCKLCWNDDGLSIPAIGSMLVICPPDIDTPVGVFIHAFTITTKIADAAPLAATSNPDVKCARAEMRSQP
jgi:hypothetical protein